MHKQSQHEGVTYFCDQCNFKTLHKQTLKIHKGLKHGGINFDCDQCDYKTKVKASLRLHKQSKRGESSIIAISVTTMHHSNNTLSLINS